MDLKHIIFFTVIVSILTFLLGISFGYYLYNYESQILYSNYESIKSLVESAQYLLLQYNNTCNIEGLYLLGNKLDELGNEISLLKQSQSPFYSSYQYKLLKTEYFNLEYLHFLLAYRQLYKCNQNYTLILYFYGNVTQCKDNSCYNEGNQLTLLKSIYNNQLLIYSFNINYPNFFIYYYKEYYNITKVPTIILINKNYTKIFYGYTNYTILERYI